jgi:hypothetical protein
MFEAVCSRDPSEPPPDELALLVGHLPSGDGQALETLYEASIGKLYAFALAMLRNAKDAEEVVCETYAQAWETAASFDPRRGSVMGECHIGSMRLEAGDAHFAAAGVDA